MFIYGFDKVGDYHDGFLGQFLKVTFDICRRQIFGSLLRRIKQKLDADNAICKWAQGSSPEYLIAAVADYGWDFWCVMGFSIGTLAL